MNVKNHMAKIPLQCAVLIGLLETGLMIIQTPKH